MNKLSLFRSLNKGFIKHYSFVIFLVFSIRHQHQGNLNLKCKKNKIAESVSDVAKVNIV